MSGPMSVVQPINDLLGNRRVSTGPMALSKFSCFTYILLLYIQWRAVAAASASDNDDDGYNILLLERDSCCY